MWKKHRRVKYIDFDKTKEPNYTSLDTMIQDIRSKRTVDSQFKDDVITYLKGCFPIIVDYKEGNIIKVLSNIIIDDGTKSDSGNTTDKQLTKYMKKVGRTFKGGKID